MVAGLVETIGRARFGDDGRMLPNEKEMIIRGIEGSCNSLPADVVQKISDISAPVMACTGLVLYMYRMGLVETQRRANRAENTAVKTAERIFREQRTSPPPTPPTPPIPPSPPVGGMPADANAYVPSKDEIMDLINGGS